MSTTYRTAVKRSSSVLLATGAVLGLAMVSSAPAFADSESISIRYPAYQLDSQAGAEDLYRKIQNAVDNYCVDFGVRSLKQRVQERQCVATMLDSAVAKIGNKRLTAIHEGSNTTLASLAP